jgi:hypothetical protein
MKGSASGTDPLRDAMFVITSLILVSALPAASAQSAAFLAGCVTNKDNGMPFNGTLVQVYDVAEPNNAVSSVYTDVKGCYNTSVKPGNYNIYVRIGNTHPTQSVYVQAGQIQQVDFRISMKSVLEEQLTSSNMFWIQVGIAGIILAVIVVDQLFFKKKRILGELAAERTKLEAEMKKDEGWGWYGEVNNLRKEKKQLEYMINLTRTKYHERSINEESYREIIRDYQEKLIEVEAKIAALESDRTDKGVEEGEKK